MIGFFKKYAIPVGIFVLFVIIGVVFWLIWDMPFYIFNFTYIGFFGALSIGLMIAGKKNARTLSEFAIGLYMLIYLGLLGNENNQLEGFFYFLALGVFQFAVIHYFVAKIGGPFVFGRAWCGYACWTAMVLDILPFKVPLMPHKGKLGSFR